MEHTNSSRKSKLYTEFRNANHGNTIKHVLGPIHIPRALNTGTCVSDLERRAQ